MGNKLITEIVGNVCPAHDERPPLSTTYMLVVDDHAVLTGWFVGTHMLLDAPVTAPPALNTPTATVNGKQSLQTDISGTK